MRLITIILLVTISPLLIHSQPVNSSPKIKDIVREFYSNYSTDDLDYPEVAFEKRKQGWFVSTQKRNGTELIVFHTFLFYDNNQMKFDSLPLKRLNETKVIDPANYFNEYILRNYDIQIFYGYRGWYKDVIKELSDKKNLSDDELNGLARAYSAYAAGMLFDQGDMLKSDVLQLSLNINCLSSEQIKQYNSLENNAQKFFKELTDKNPSYETAVGTIGMKSANEIMVQYTTLLAFANDYAQKMKLPENLYSDEVLSTAEQILENSPKDAIYISYGDDDFYPLYYLQVAKNFRKDVYVINYNMIAVDRYIYRMTFPVHDAQSIGLSTDSSLYKGEKNNYILFNGSPNAIEFTDLLQALKFGEKDFNGFTILKADKILLPMIDSLSKSTSREVSLKGVQYLYKNQWILLDIINNLKGRRISLPNTFTDELIGLNDYITLSNDLYILK